MLLPTVLASIAFAAATLPVFNVIGPICVALIFGIIWRVVFGLPENAEAGLKFASRTLLRLGIVLLGARLNFLLVQTVGPKVLAIDLCVIVTAIGGISTVGRALGLPRELAILMGFGTGICGASAVVAAASVARADEESTSLAVGLMGVLGTVGVFFYVLVGPLLGLTHEQLGVLTGSSLHEVAQVIAAASPFGEVGLKLATLVKLTRVVLLAPALVVAGFVFNRGEAGKVKFSLKEPPIPYFVMGFLAIGALNTWGGLYKPVADALIQASVFLMAIAMGGMGLHLDLGMVRRTGWRAVGVGIAGFLTLFGLSLGLIHLLGVGSHS